MVHIECPAAQSEFARLGDAEGAFMLLPNRDLLARAITGDRFSVGGESRVILRGCSIDRLINITDADRHWLPTLHGATIGISAIPGERLAQVGCGRKLFLE